MCKVRIKLEKMEPACGIPTAARDSRIDKYECTIRVILTAPDGFT